MYYDDHGPPHFHAVYQGAGATIDIEALVIGDGRLPPRALSLVMEWATLHQQDLRAAWERAERHEPPGTIEPLP